MADILVTGGAGHLGQAIVGTLRAAGRRVLALDCVTPPEVGDVGFVRGDLCDERLYADLPGHTLHYLVHCAAVLPNERISAAEAGGVNERIDALVARFLARHANVCVIYLSGTSVYAQAEGERDEDSPTFAANPYVAAKLRGELQFAALPNRDVSLRVTAPYSYRLRAPTVLRQFVEAAVRGDDLRYLGTGSRSQDFTHVNDVASAVVACIDAADASGPFNISAGQPISMRCLADLVVSLVPESRSRVVAAGQPDPQEDYRAHFATGRARTVLGWTPRITLEAGLKQWVERLRWNA